MDDILIFSRNMKEHRETVREVLTRLRHHGLYLKLSKCQFEQTEVEFLGLVIYNGQAKMDPVKTKVIDEWPEPWNLQEMRSFMQFCNFYQNFIPHFTTLAKPLNMLTEKDAPWNWTDEHR